MCKARSQFEWRWVVRFLALEEGRGSLDLSGMRVSKDPDSVSQFYWKMREKMEVLVER